MISIASEYLTAFIIVQICMIPLFIIFLVWSGKYSNYKVQNNFLSLLCLAGFVLPFFFLIPEAIGSVGVVANSLFTPGVYSMDPFPVGFTPQIQGLGPVVNTGLEEVSNSPEKQSLLLNLVKQENFTSLFLPAAGRTYRILYKFIHFFGLLFFTGIILGTLIFIYKIVRHSKQILFFKKSNDFKWGKIASVKYRIYRSQRIPTPFSSGLIFPAVYMPNSLSSEEEQIVLRHEEVHIRHYHILWIWFFELYSSLFWFYPVAKYMKNWKIRLQDLIADKETLEIHDSRIYVKTLIKCADILSGWDGPFVFTAGAASGKNLRERINQIINKKSCLPSYFSRWMFIAVLLFVSGLLAGFISCSKEDPAIKSSITGSLEIVKAEEVKSESIVETVNPMSKAEEFLLQFENPDSEENKQIFVRIDSEPGNNFYIMKDFTVLSEIVKSEGQTGIPVLWPLDKGQGRITQPFGPSDAIPPIRNDPWFHLGIDIAASVGTGILATADGIVAETGSAPDSFGNYIIIYHDFGFSTLYAKLKDIAVETDQVVKQGEIIGTLGNSGRSTGPHLHYTISLSQLSGRSGTIFKNGIYIDPMELIP